MKRGLVFSLCALAAVASAAAVQAQTVDLSLNLRYTNPANPSQGGTWYLVAKTSDVDGIAGISAYINGIDEAGMNYGNTGAVDTRYGTPGTVTALTIQAIENGGQPYRVTIDGAVNVVYGQDITTGFDHDSNGGTANINLAGVGRGAGTPGNVALDPLRNSTWDNTAIIANGTFGAVRPTIATNVGAGDPVGFPGNNTDANTLAGTALSTNAQDAATTIVIRGDAERGTLVEGANKGLFAGDANRDGVVNSSDLALLLLNYEKAGTKGWGDGNFNNTAGNANTNVNSSDLALLLLNYEKAGGVPVSLTAIPEPSSIALVACGGMLALALRRRRA